jgi:hypothetical protein
MAHGNRMTSDTALQKRGTSSPTIPPARQRPRASRRAAKRRDHAARIHGPNGVRAGPARAHSGREPHTRCVADDTTCLTCARPAVHTLPRDVGDRDLLLLLRGPWGFSRSRSRRARHLARSTRRDPKAREASASRAFSFWAVFSTELEDEMKNDMHLRWLRLRRHLRSCSTSTRTLRAAARALSAPTPGPQEFLCRPSLPCRLAA